MDTSLGSRHPLSAPPPLLFVSYSRADLMEVKGLARELRRLGLRTWVDLENLRPGEKWKEAIEQAMREARAFVLCISKRSIESAWTSHELKSALQLGLDVVPVMIEPMPLNILPETIRSRQIVNLHAFAHRNAARATAFSVARTVLPEMAQAEHGSVRPPFAGSLIVLLGNMGFEVAEAEAVVCLITVEELTSPIVLDVLDAADRARNVHLYISADANKFEAAYLIGTLSTRVGARRLTVTQTLDGAIELRDLALRCGTNHRVVAREHLRVDVFKVAGA